VLLHDNEPARAVIEEQKTTRETLDELLALLESSEADKFVAHLYQVRAVQASLQTAKQGQQGNKP
jgi:hypothetical protein